MEKLVVCDHPLIQHKLTFIRDMRTNTKDFRELVDEVATLMAYEITRDILLNQLRYRHQLLRRRQKLYLDGC